MRKCFLLTGTIIEKHMRATCESEEKEKYYKDSIDP